jgi:hypothetical protein
VSIDRSSSDKENNSLILSSSSDVPTATISTSISKTKSATNQKKSIGSRRSRLSARTAMINSRTQAGKKQDYKTSPKVRSYREKEIKYISEFRLVLNQHKGVLLKRRK